MPTLVSPAQMDNSYLKENAMPDALSHLSMEDVLTSVQADSSLKPEVETVLSVTTDAGHVMVLLTDVLPVNQAFQVMAHVSQLAQPTLLLSMETVSPALKDVMDVGTPLANVLLANQDTSWSDQDVLPHVMQVSSEMETTDAEDAQKHAHHVHQPLPVLHVLKPETNLSTVSATPVSTHAHHALRLNNVLLV